MMCGGRQRGSHTCVPMLLPMHKAPCFSPFWVSAAWTPQKPSAGGGLQHTYRQGCAGTWPARVCTSCFPQPSSSREQPPATTPGFSTSSLSITASSLAVTRAAVLPPGTPKPGCSKGRSPYPFLPGIKPSPNCSKPKQRPALLFCGFPLHPSHLRPHLHQNGAG